MIEVTRAGFYTSVQDLGRHGYRHIGVGLSGAMDELALSVGNLLIGNPVDTPGIEITMGHVCFTFRMDAEIALAGADADATLEGRPLPNWWALSVKAGQVLRLAAPRQGLRSYLAIRGGLDVPYLLGSAATDLKGGFGGLNGRILKNGDMLQIAEATPLARPNPGFGLSPWRLSPYLCVRGGREDASGRRDWSPQPRRDRTAVSAAMTEPSTPPVVHILPAAQWPDLTEEAQQLLVDAVWQVSPQSNRVGCRLEGRVLETRVRGEMRSHGIMPGVVQLPPAGLPIVQLCDGNTSGGYPVIASVIQADLHLFAQFRPKSLVRFAICDLAQAEARSICRQRYLDDIAMRCELTRRRFY